MIKLNKPLVIVIGILAFGAFAYNLYESPDVSYLLGKEVNNWLYRAFWILIIIVCIYNYIQIDKNTLKNKSKSSLGGVYPERSRSTREPKFRRKDKEKE